MALLVEIPGNRKNSFEPPNMRIRENLTPSLLFHGTGDVLADHGGELWFAASFCKHGGIPIPYLLSRISSSLQKQFDNLIISFIGGAKHWSPAVICPRIRVGTEGQETAAGFFWVTTRSAHFA
jgi:hypothetical protein